MGSRKGRGRPKNATALRAGPENTPLTSMQARFVDEYLVDLNGKQAAIRAGYSEHTAESQASRLLRNVKVAAALSERQKVLADRVALTQERVLKELARIGFSDIRDLFEWSAERVAFVPSSDLTADQAAAIAQVKAETTHYDREDGTRETKVKLELKTYDKLPALDRIGKHLGLFPSKVQVEGSDGNPLVFQVFGVAPTAE